MSATLLPSVVVLLTALLALGALLAAGASAESRFEERSIVLPGGSSTGTTYRYRLLAPDAVRGRMKQPLARWPLVVFLHGAGERGADNRLQLRYLPELLASPEERERHPTYVLAPQCPAGTCWSALDLDGLKVSFPAEPAPAARAALAALDTLLEELPVDRDRVYLTGISMGGYGTWDLAARFPERWAAAAPVCGGGLVETARRLKDLPLWAFHGGKDDVVPPEKSREMIAALERSGARPRYTEFPDVAHDSWTPAYQLEGFLDWLFSQRRGPLSGPPANSLAK